MRSATGTTSAARDAPPTLMTKRMRDAVSEGGTSMGEGGSPAMSIVALERRVITSWDVRADIGTVVCTRATPL